jgi:hypothetical protein
MEVRVAREARVSLGVVASEDRILGSAERDIAVPHGRTVRGASQSLSAPQSGNDMEVRAAREARVSLGVVASEGLSPGSAERDFAVPHGRTVRGASQSVLAPIKPGHGGTRREGLSREPRRRRV